jgi:hypothetical protein
MVAAIHRQLMKRPAEYTGENGRLALEERQVSMLPFNKLL